MYQPVDNLRRASNAGVAEDISVSRSSHKSNNGATRAFIAAERAQKAAKEAADAIAACSSDRSRPASADQSLPAPVPLQTPSTPPSVASQTPRTPPGSFKSLPARLTESALLEHTARSVPFSLKERVIPETKTAPAPLIAASFAQRVRS
jgi:hypothetical protein